jgi:hypothetical protein
MIKVLLSSILFMFTSVVYGQSKDSLQVVSNDINDSEEVFEIGMDEEIDNFDFLYTNNGEIFNYDEVLVDNMMQEAYKHIGARYRYGSKGPNAFDCSGFTSFVYKKSNMNIGASSREQYARNIPIKREDLQPGDLVFFTSPGSRRGVGHVGIVVDYDPISNVFTFIHASTSSGVKLSKSSESNYARRYVGARRVQN